MREYIWPGLRRRLQSQVGPSRRDLLKETLAATAGLLLSRQTVRASAVGKRVVVVGAGFAGLACAHELLAVGYDVVVLEASDRIGGRVLTLNNFVKGRSVELGGEFIGSNHLTWVAYAKKFGLNLLKVEDADDEDERLFVDGEALKAKALEELEHDAEKAFAALTRLALLVNAEEPWKSPNADRLDRKTMREWIDALDASAKVKWYLTLFFNSENGVPVEAQSLLGNLAPIKGGGLARYWTDGETHRCDGGNSLLTKKLAEAIGPKRIHPAAPVRGIVQKNNKCIVHTVDGKRFEADDVVLTVPPSVWSKLTLDPSLPFEGHPQMGVAVKWLARLDGRFWDDEEISSNAVSDGDLNETWESTKAQPGSGEAGLVGFSTGASARNVQVRDAKDREAWYRREMEIVYPGFSKHFLESKFADWTAEPWTKGSYSFSAPGQIMKMGPVLRAGVENLHFAGEHTCFSFTGYMEGALHSGVSLARRLALRDGLVKPG